MEESPKENVADRLLYVHVPGPHQRGDSTQWQYQVIDFVRGYEQRMGYDRHPIGMTMQFPVLDQARVNDPLFGGPADWVSQLADIGLGAFCGRGSWAAAGGRHG